MNVLVLGCGLLLSSLAMGQNTPYYEKKSFEVAMYPAADHDKLWINVARYATVGQIKVAIFDAAGRPVFSEWIPKQQTRFRQRFDLSRIDDGTYTFVVTDGNQELERTFRLSTPGLQEQLPKRLITIRDADTTKNLPLKKS